MWMAGCADGCSHRNSRTSSASGSDTQPAVAPTATWRKIADPRPGTTGRTLYRITAKYRYWGAIRQSASLSPPKDGFTPQTTWRNVLYVGDAGSSSHQS